MLDPHLGSIPLDTDARGADVKVLVVHGKLMEVIRFRLHLRVTAALNSAAREKVLHCEPHIHQELVQHGGFKNNLQVSAQFELASLRL